MVGFWQRQRRQLRAVEAEERWAFDDGDGKINGRSHIHKSWFQRHAWASNNDDPVLESSVMVDAALGAW